MEKINYPLLYYELNPETYLGILVGAGMQVIDGDLRRIKSLLQDQLHKQYKKTDSYPLFDIEEPRLKILRVNIRPTHRESGGDYPLPFTVKVPVPVVYGQTGPDSYECHLPLLDYHFYYYQADQWEPLAQHLISTVLNQAPPGQIYRLLQYPKPRLDTVSLRVNMNREFRLIGFEFHRRLQTLPRLAEPYPSPKTVRRAHSSLPEAAWEMEEKVNEVVDRLLNTRSNVLIVGNRGVGKSAVLRQAMRKIVQQTKKQEIQTTFWRIMPQRITASSKYLGEWEEAVESLVEELTQVNGILWVIDLIQLLATGGSGPEDSVAAFLMTYLQQNKLQLVGEATPQELESMRRLLPGFIGLFQVVPIEDPPSAKVQSILDQFVLYARRQHQIAIEGDALATAFRLLLRFYPYESFPGKGIRFLGQCVSEAKLNQNGRVSRPEVLNLFIRQTGLPELLLRDDLLLDPDELQAFFTRRIIGQPAAVDKLCEVVKIFKVGLNNPFRPVSTLLFAGPTGVGKTASAKALADYFFGQGQKHFPLIRIDMSEFRHPGQISRLIGSGREVGQLVREIRDKPFSVLLLDEVEKADPSIFDALLTVLDEGVLADAYGRLTNFRNTIIIMTTNLGAGSRPSIGFSQTTSEEKNYLSALEQYFRPEFINRIDGILIFQPLQDEHIRRIAEKELDELKNREGLIKRNIRLTFTERVVDYLTRAGFDPRYGARPLQRAIEHQLVTPLATWLLNNPGATDRTLRVDYEGGIVFG